MPEFSIFETALIAVAAVILAVEQGLVDAPRLTARMPAWIRSPRWRYAPAVLIVVAAAAFGYRKIVGEPAPSAPPATPPKVVTRTVTVSVPDPAQAARIIVLEKQLALLHPRQPKPPKAKPAAGPSKPTDEDSLLDQLRCQNAQQKLQERLDGFISMATLYQGGPADEVPLNNTALASDYSAWLAEVESYIKPMGDSVIYPYSEFVAAHGTDLMRAPARLDADKVAVWREFEAKKAVLRKYLDVVASSRCSAGPD